MIHILHISDLHFVKNAAAYNTEEILLREAARKVKDIPLGKKLLIVTGDFHNFWDQDYEKAEDFLQKLVSKMGLDIRQDVFVIPGNHDVGNDTILKPFLEPKDRFWKKHQKSCLTMLKNGDKDNIEERLQVFSSYSSFVRKLGIYTTSSSDDYPARSHIRCWRGKLNILHLNTALIADGTSKTEQMTDADMAASPETWKYYFDPTVPSLAIGHNAYFDLQKGQRKDLAAVFNLRNVSAYLCGDMHRTEKDPEHQMIRLQSGHRRGIEIPNLVAPRSIADEKDDYSDVGFCWHYWDEETDNVTVEFRKWTRENLAETAPDGLQGEYVMRREKPNQPDQDDIKKNIKKEKLSEKGDNYAPLRRYLADVLKQRRDSHPSFQLLTVDEIDSRLYPGIEEYKQIPPMGTTSGNPDHGNDNCPVWDIIQNSWSSAEHRSIVITGDGGIGKTVTLLSISRESFKNISVPALYIPMYELVDTNGNLLELDNYIGKRYPKYSGEIDALATEIWNTQPSLLLLLDGFNEVPFSLRRKALVAVNNWYDTRPGVQIIAVSRPLDRMDLARELAGGKTIPIKLAPLSENIIRTYLKDAGLTLPPGNSKIWKVLIYPLFLNLFVKTGSLKEYSPAGYPLYVKDANSAGTLIWNYLQRELLRYSKDVPEKAESWVLRCAVANEFILPYLAYGMVTEQRMVINGKQVIKRINEALTHLDGKKLPRHLKSIWQTYEFEHGEVPNKDIFLFKVWTDTVLQDSGILIPHWIQNNDSNPLNRLYVFTHQHFRDCLAALYLVNIAEISGNEFPSVWKQGQTHLVMNYIADLIDEETVNRLWENNRLKLKYKTLGFKKDHRGTNTLLELQKRIKPSPENLNFSEMDLRNFSLAHYMVAGDDYLPLFQKCFLLSRTKINRSTIQLEGHSDQITCISILPDGRIVSGSYDASLIIWDPNSGRCLQKLKGHSQRITCLSVLPNGQIISGSLDGSLRIWDSDSGRCLHKLKGHFYEITCLTVLPNSHFISGSLDGFCVWDLNSGRCLHKISGDLSLSITCLAVLPNGHIISGSRNGVLRFWDPNSGYCLHELTEYFKMITCLVVLPNGWIVSGSFDGSLHIWDPDYGFCLNELWGHSNKITCLAILSDGRLVSASEDKTLRIWDTDSWRCLHILRGHFQMINCLAVLSNGRIISGSVDASIRIWDSDSGRCLKILKGHSGGISCLTVLPDGRFISGSVDASIRVWDSDSGQCLQIFEGHSQRITSLAVLSDGHLVSASGTAPIQVWDSDSGRCLKIMDGHSQWVTCLATLSDGRLVSASGDGSLQVLDPNSERCLWLLEGHSQRINCLSVLSDNRLISGSSDSSIRVWSPDSGQCLQILEGHSSEITCLAVLTDSCFVSGSLDSSIRVWDPNSGRCLQILKRKHFQYVIHLAVLTDGHIVSAYSDGSIWIWDPNTGKLIRKLEVFSHWINCLTVLTDGRLVNDSDDGSLQVWDTNSGKCLRVLEGHSAPIRCLDVLPNGHIISGSDDATLRVWDTNTGKCLQVLEGQSGSVNHLAVLPNNRIISSSNDKFLRLWDLTNGICIMKMESTDVDISQMDFTEAILKPDLAKMLWQNRAKISKSDYEKYVLPTLPK